MRFSQIKAKLAQGEPVLVTCCHFPDASLYEMVSLMGFDGIWLDLEHHSFSDETAGALMRAARCGASDMVVRPAKGEFMRIGRLLESGAQAIMYPRCESAEEAAELVRWSKFAPQGVRGQDGAGGDNPYCLMPLEEYRRAANEHTVLIAQLESTEALDNAEAIARVPGIDILMIGPGDLSALSCVPFAFDSPLVMDACRRVAAAAAAAGIHWGMPSSGPEHSKMLLDMGARFICHGSDILIVQRALMEIQRKYGELGFRFANRIPEMVDSLRRAVSSGHDG